MTTTGIITRLKYIYHYGTRMLKLRRVKRDDDRFNILTRVHNSVLYINPRSTNI